MPHTTEEQEHPQAPQVTLRAAGLAVAYKTTVALKIPSLSCTGGVIAVVGHNGAGKSTLIKSVLGLLPPTSGRLSVTYYAGAGAHAITPERDMAFCPETGAVFSDISVESYIKLWCRIKHRNPRFYRGDGARYLELLNIEPLLHKLGRELSKGQRRRVQTAIGFLTEPKLFLFDEPFDGLDVQRTSELADLVLAHRTRMTFIISSHRMDVMERIADQVLVLKQGSVTSVGSLDTVCAELAGTTFQLSQLTDIEKLYKLLKTRYPNA
ncbi:MAG: ABC transporter ATP-binding protein, partial [Proteobacteria bacterium]|nr:ABC transporter ATP-binding protein [Pseudomonadota bacterium]